MLATQKLTLMTGQKILVRDVSLGLQAGESLALMGSSGSGKSLTAMALAGFLPPSVVQSEGSVQQGLGRPALIMQNPADCFDPLFRLEWVFHETFCQDMPKKELPTFIHTLLQRVGFSDPQAILQSYPFELSGGMLHRCMIALALGAVLVGKTSCIIADEPLSGLDTPSKKYILQLIRQLQAEYGFALLYIDHDLAAAAQVATTLAIMHEGQVVEQGIFASVVENPQHEATQAMVQAYGRMREIIPSGSTAVPSQGELTKDTVLVEAQDISKSYGSKTVLEHISVCLRAGRSLGLVGANGAGKSTFMRMLLGLENADTGSIHCLGHKVCKISGQAVWRRHMQAVFQHARLAVNPRMQAQDILLEPLRAHKKLYPLAHKEAATAKAQALLSLVDLPESFIKKYPSHMSGGQLQRLCLARALALQPEVILLDECLADLDAVVSEHLQEKLLHLKQELHLSFVYISHDIRSVLRLCDDIVVLDKGRVVDVFNSHEYNAAHRHSAFTHLLTESL